MCVCSVECVQTQASQGQLPIHHISDLRIINSSLSDQFCILSGIISGDPAWSPNFQLLFKCPFIQFLFLNRMPRVVSVFYSTPWQSFYTKNGCRQQHILKKRNLGSVIWLPQALCHSQIHLYNSNQWIRTIKVKTMTAKSYWYMYQALCFISNFS